MRPAISLNPETGTTRWQDDAEPCSYHLMLGVVRSEYERVDVMKSPVVKDVPMAEVTWQQARATADVMKDVSEYAFRLEMLRRGYEVAGKILSGKVYDSGKKKHVRRKRKGK